LPEQENCSAGLRKAFLAWIDPLEVAKAVRGDYGRRVAR
jgi:hypothetical protein